MLHRQAIASIALLAASPAALAQAPGPPDYAVQVAPILTRYCTGCHNAQDEEGKLVLESYESLLRGGKRGEEIVPGKSSESRLVLVLEGKAKPKMPPKDNPAPAPEEVAILKAWIDAGARGPATGAAAAAALVTPRIEPALPPRLAVNAAAFSPDGLRIALGRHREVEILDAGTRASISRIRGLPGPVNALCFSADGSRLAAASGEPGLAGEARLWTLHAAATGGEPLRVLRGHRDCLYAAALSPDGKVLATAGYDFEIKLWSVESSKELRTLKGHQGAVFDVAFRPGGRIIASASADRTVKIWDADTGRRLDTFSQPLKDQNTVAFSPDGARLAAGGADNRIRVWRISETGAEGSNPLTAARFAHEGSILKLVFSADGRWLASAADDRTVKIWDAGAMAERRLLELQPDWPAALCFSVDGRTLVVGRLDGTVGFYDAPTGQPVRLSVIVPRTGPAAPLLGAPLLGAPLLGGPLRGAPLLGALLLGAPEEKPKPEIASIEPRGIQRGTRAAVRIRGKSLAPAGDVKTSNEKLSVRRLDDPAPRPDEVWILAAAAADLDRGSHEVWLVTPGGDSNRVRLFADDLPQLDEAEPNDAPPGSPAAPPAVSPVAPPVAPPVALPVALPSSLWGGFGARGDVDFHPFEARAGETIVLDLEAAALGSKANCVLAVCDPSGRVLASSNDFDQSPDPLIAWTAPAAGRYAARVTDLEANASSEHFYRLSIGAFPFATGCHPLGVPANAETAVELTGFNVPPGAKAVVKAGGPGEAAVPVDPSRFRSRRAQRVVVSAVPQIVEAEPNDSPASANRIPAPGAASGRLWTGGRNGERAGERNGERRGANAAGARSGVPSGLHAGARSGVPADAPSGAPSGAPSDADLFRFAAKAGQAWIIETHAARLGSPADTKLEVLDLEGKPVPRVLLQAVRDSYVTFRGIDSVSPDVRLKNWEEMELNQYLYLAGEVARLFRAPQGPDSGFLLYSLDGRRRAYFDTTATVHALDEPCYIVEPYPPGAALVPNGLPVFELHHENDDDADRRLGADSRLSFAPPADGEYIVRVTDSRGQDGARVAYNLTLREARPSFRVTLHGANPSVGAGSGRSFTVAADRTDGFDGDITVRLSGLPPGFTASSPLVIQAGHVEAKGTLFAAAGAEQPSESSAASIKVTAEAAIAGKLVTQDVNGLGRIQLAPKPKLLVRLEPEGGAAAITIAPGQMVPAMLRIERNGHDDLVTFQVENLPHGVIVDDIGLSGVLIRKGENERRIFLAAAKWVPEADRPCHAIESQAGGQTSPPVMVHVRKGAVAARP